MIPNEALLPAASGPNRPHWEGALRGKVVVQQCSHCGTFRFPASPICAHCTQAGHTWTEIRPTGTIRSWCRFHRSYFPGMQEQLPYTVLLVQLDDDVWLYSNPEEEYPHDAFPRIGERVVARFVPVNDTLALLRFAPS